MRQWGTAPWVNVTWVKSHRWWNMVDVTWQRQHVSWGIDGTHTHRRTYRVGFEQEVGVMVVRSLRRRAVLALTSLAVVSVGVVSPVAADDGVVATETGEALEVAGSLVADAAPLSDTGDGFVAVVGGSEVELPADPAESLVLDGAAGEIGVDLPVVAGLGDGVVDESGAVVYQSDTSPVSLAAQATQDGGMQVLVVIDGPDAPTEYRFDMTIPEGASIVPTGDGGAAVIGVDGAPLIQIAPPWAFDANGTEVDTSYRFDGSTLIQYIDHVEATYPVVADPKLSYGWSVYLKYSKKEVKDFKSQAPVIGAAALLGWACAALPAKPLIGVCLVSVAIVGAAIVDTFNKAADENKCVELKFSYTGDIDGWKRYRC